MLEQLFLGLDFGTDSVRALLISENGEELALDVQAYPRWAAGQYCDPGSNRYRQHPLDYLECLEKAIKNVLKGDYACRVAGISLATTASTPCAVDKNGTPLALLENFSDNPNAMFILWKDHSAIEEAELINQAAESFAAKIDFRKYSGGTYSSEWFWSKILHVLRQDTAVAEAAYSWVEHCDWVAGELAGRTEPLSMKRSRCAAGHKAMWHADWQGLPTEEFLAELDPRLASLRQRLYSETLTSDKLVGKISKKWAKKLGLSENVVIGVPGIDCHFAAVGSEIKPFELVKACGTSTCDVIAVPELDFCVPGICGQVDGSVLPGLIGLEAGQSAFGDVYAWFKNFLSYAGEVSLSKLEAEASQIVPGSTSVFAVDWFNGRRSPYANPLLNGAICGLQLSSTAPMVYRALIESTLFAAKHIVEHFKDHQIPIETLIATGGISQKSPLIMQMMADIIEMPVKVTANEQCCALGAAMFAAVVAGKFSSINDAMQKMGKGYNKIYYPDKDKREIYRELYKKYLKLAKQLEEIK